jgi:hypothetical protein
LSGRYHKCPALEISATFTWRLALSETLILALRGFGFLFISWARCSIAECLFVLGNLLPGLVGSRLWSAALVCNPEHYAAALNRAAWLFDSASKATDERNVDWRAFLRMIDCIQNPRNVSASDLYGTWVPGRLFRRALARVKQGPGNQLNDQRDWDRILILRSVDLAKCHLTAALGGADTGRAEQALDVWRSLAGNTLESQWAEAELKWMTGSYGAVSELTSPLIQRGCFMSPLAPLLWAERFIGSGQLALAGESLGWARRWVPEEGKLWRLLARLSFLCGDPHQASKYAQRALSLDPQDVDSFLVLRALERGGAILYRDESRKLLLFAPAELDMGASCQVTCSIEAGCGTTTLFVLPPAGWGVVPEQTEMRFDGNGRATIRLRSCRPDRIHGGGWPVTFIALTEDSYSIARCEVRVPDFASGTFLVTVTEDHEIHEERGALPADMLHRLLVEKSRFASSLGVPWTHMVETGSSLSLLEWAAQRGDESWKDLHESVMSHLMEEVAAGNDIQVHLHAFNDPAYSHFPYTLRESSVCPSLRFLLTSPEGRGDWASACPAPGDLGLRSIGRLDRIESVNRSACKVEAIGRLGDPDYRAVLWRSGLLEFGNTEEDMAWSCVALRRAGLLAASDAAKPASVLSSEVAAAFPASWEKPFEARPGGPLLQMPIACNLEGDYLMGVRLLARRARKIAKRLRMPNDRIKPGVHLFTLLTHDKFINARFGGDEFRMDSDYGDWVTILDHVSVWTRTGASFVTARQGIRLLLDDISWRLVPWMDQETFICRRVGEQEVRYRITMIGRGITASEAFPHHVLIAAPLSVRGKIICVRVMQNGLPLAIEMEKEGTEFWVRLTNSETPLFCNFTLNEEIGPVIEAFDSGPRGAVRLVLSSPVRFLRARVLLPWRELQLGVAGLQREFEARDAHSTVLDCRPEADGLLLSPLRFEADGMGGVLPLEITLLDVVMQAASGDLRVDSRAMQV